MNQSDPLIITATPNVSWLHPEIAYPQTLDTILEESILCEQAGASILHIHAEGMWSEVIRGLRDRTEMIVQCGMSSLPIPDRMEVFQNHADMISIIVSHHDEAFVGVDTHALHPREELADYAKLSAEYGVKLELETWHTGSIWNIRYLIGQGLLHPPYFTSLFFGWPGGSWTPPTVEEYLRRRADLPEESVATVSIMDPAQMRILTAAITHGDHVRVGTEDHPHDLVAEIADVARAVGRGVATPHQAREIIGLGAAIE
jgi:3-keto-5-aminohexanoate cleavage enzyme